MFRSPEIPKEMYVHICVCTFVYLVFFLFVCLCVHASVCMDTMCVQKTTEVNSSIGSCGIRVTDGKLRITYEANVS